MAGQPPALDERSIVLRRTAAWLPALAIAIANGALRESVFARRMSESRAHQLSTATLLAAFTGYEAALERLWPLPTRRAATRVGAAWLLLTVGFEFSFGRLVGKRQWAELVRDYDITKGRLWALVPAWVALAPEAMRRSRR